MFYSRRKGRAEIQGVHPPAHLHQAPLRRVRRRDQPHRQEVGSRAKAFKLVKHDKKLVRFFLPLEPKNPDDAVWSIIRTLSDKIGEQLTTHLRAIADANPLLKGIIDRIDFNATTHGQRDIDDARLSNLIEAISAKRLGLTDVEADIIGRSYEYLIRKFAEGGGQSAGEFYTPGEVGEIMALIMDPQPGMEHLRSHLRLRRPAHQVRAGAGREDEGRRQEDLRAAQALRPGTGARHLGHGEHEHDHPRHGGRDRDRRHIPQAEVPPGQRLQTFDRAVANPMWNQTEFKEKDYDADELDRFPKGAGFPGGKADWGWVQHILASLKPQGRAAVVLDTGAASRGSGNANTNKEKDVRRWFVEQDLIEGVIYLPENLFYNTTAPGIILVLNRAKPKERKGKIFLLNASREFTKGDPKNYIPEDAIRRIADTFSAWKEVEKYSRIVSREEIAKNDFNISPSRYIHTGEATNTGRLRRLWRNWRRWKRKRRTSTEGSALLLKSNPKLAYEICDSRSVQTGGYAAPIGSLLRAADVRVADLPPDQRRRDIGGALR